MVILLVNSSAYENKEEILKVVNEFCNGYKIKARNLAKNHLDMAVEVDCTRQGELVREAHGVTKCYFCFACFARRRSDGLSEKLEMDLIG